MIQEFLQVLSVHPIAVPILLICFVLPLTIVVVAGAFSVVVSIINGSVKAFIAVLGVTQSNFIRSEENPIPEERK